MAHTKGSKKVVNVFVCLVMIGFICFIVYQHQQIKVLSKALKLANEAVVTQVPEQNNNVEKGPTQNNALASKGKGKNNADDLGYQLDAAEEELDSAHKQLSDTLVGNAENANWSVLSPEEMLKTPEGRKRLQNALKNGLDQTYSALFKQLDLSPDKLSQFKELLADQSIASMEFNNEVQGASPTGENRNRLRQRQEELKEKDDAAVAALLGIEDYQTFKDYEDRSQERNTVQMFSQTLSDDDTLTGEQKKALIESMYKERTDTLSPQGIDKDRVMFPSDWDDEGIANMLETNTRVNDGYIKAAEATLSESQAQQFSEYLEKQQAMLKAGLKQQSRMAGGETKQDDAETDGDEAGQTGEMIVIMR